MPPYLICVCLVLWLLFRLARAVSSLTTVRARSGKRNQKKIYIYIYFFILLLFGVSCCDRSFGTRMNVLDLVHRATLPHQTTQCFTLSLCRQQPFVVAMPGGSAADRSTGQRRTDDRIAVPRRDRGRRYSGGELNEEPCPNHSRTKRAHHKGAFVGDFGLTRGCPCCSGWCNICKDPPPQACVPCPEPAAAAGRSPGFGAATSSGSRVVRGTPFAPLCPNHNNLDHDHGVGTRRMMCKCCAKTCVICFPTL